MWYTYPTRSQVRSADREFVLSGALAMMAEPGLPGPGLSIDKAAKEGNARKLNRGEVLLPAACP